VITFVVILLTDEHTNRTDNITSPIPYHPGRRGLDLT